MKKQLGAAVLLALSCAAIALAPAPARAQTETIVASDDFNRADETPFSIAGNWGRTIAGNYDGFSNLTGNRVTSGTNEGIYYWKGPGSFSPTSQFARERVVDSNGEPALILLGGADHALLLTWGPPGPGANKSVFIYWYANGQDMGVLTTQPSPLADNDVIEAVLDGGVITAKVNGVLVASTPNTTSLASGTPGFMTYANPALPALVTAIDDWQAGTPVSWSVGGTITEGGVGLAGVVVTASGGFAGSATTNASGAFTLAGVPNNATGIVLTPALAGHTISPVTRTVTGPVTGNVTGQDFTSTAVTPTLAVNATHGTVTINPPGSPYAFNTVVTLTPVPDSGYLFAGWSGDVPAGHGNDNPLAVTMNQNRTITATFALPNVVAFDDFNRADETPFSIAGNWGRTIAGNYDGFSNLTGNRVTSGTNEGIYYWKGPGSFSPTSQYARVRVLDASGEPALILLGGANQALLLTWGPPGPGANKSVFIYWYANGQDMGVLTSQPSPLANNDVIEAVLSGGIIYAKVNGVTVASIANTTTLTSGTPGFMTYANPALPALVTSIDDWEAGTPLSYSIGGTITENGVGLAGVQVAASGGFTGSTTTDSNGAYTLPGVPDGVTGVVLTPTLAGHTMSPLTRTVSGPVTGNVIGQDFTSTAATTAVLTVLATNGTVTKSPDLSPYPINTVVTLTPVPDSGYVFAGWSGNVPPGQQNDNPLVVTMSQDRTITATFGSPNIAASDGFNRANETPLVTGGNWGQSLGGTANLINGQIAGATADALYFWQGAGVFDNTKQFARARVVDATGQLGLVLLGAPGQGLVASWHDNVLYIYWYSLGAYRGNLVTLPSVVLNGDVIEAELSNGAIAAKINGNVVLSTPNTTTLTAGTPGFETFQTGGILDDWEAGTPFSYALSGTVRLNGVGLAGVAVNASGGFTGTAITNATGAYSLTGVTPNALSVVLTPTASGYTMTPTSRTVTGPVVANVTLQDFTAASSVSATLTTSASHGTIQRSPDQPSYLLGTVVTLTPVPDSGYSFAGWSGSVPTGHELDNPLQVTMDQNRTISALFLRPSVSAAEYFDRPNELPLVVGGNWAQPLSNGHADLVSNQLAGSFGDALYFWQGAGSFDNTKQFARARVVSAAGQVGLVLLGAPGQALVVSWHQGVLYVYWYSSGIYRGNLVTGGSTIKAGDTIQADLAFGKIYVSINGTRLVTVPNTTTLTSGRPGFETFQSGGILDDWEGGISTAIQVDVFPYMGSAQLE